MIVKPIRKTYNFYTLLDNTNRYVGCIHESHIDNGNKLAIYVYDAESYEYVVSNKLEIRPFKDYIRRRDAVNKAIATNQYELIKTSQYREILTRNAETTEEYKDVKSFSIVKFTTRMVGRISPISETTIATKLNKERIKAQKEELSAQLQALISANAKNLSQSRFREINHLLGV